MKNSAITKIIKIFPLLLLSVIGFNNYTITPSGPDPDQVVLAFVTYNDHGNNLYIDNITLGARPSTVDLAITSMVNIPPGTFITPGNNSLSIKPQIHLTNIGSQTFVPDSAGIYVYFRSFSNSYFDSVNIPSLNAGQDTVLIFSTNFTINPNSGVDFYAYFNVRQDTINFNDTLFQYTNFVQGVRRNMILTEFISANSLGAVSNTIGLNNFINNNFDSVNAVKYHWGIPSQNDSMYLSSKEQVDSIVNYYNASFVPLTYADGNTYVALPYTTYLLFNAIYDYRKSFGSPFSISVSDSLSGNSMTSKIDYNFVAPVNSGDYRLKVYAIQRVVHFDSVPSNWYDSTFYDVFRRAIPGIGGVSISPSGSKSLTYSYTIPAGWNPTQIFTVAFIQNESTKEILNSAKGGNFTPVSHPVNIPILSNTRNFVDFSPFITNNENLQTLSTPFYESVSGDLTYKYFVEIFEGYYPPPGWTVINPDGLFTMTKYFGANGPTFTGTNCIQIPFYDYASLSINRRDTLKSRLYYGLRDSNIVTFDYSYAPYDNTYRDSLKVLISVDGGETFPFEVFNKGGNGLATAPATTISFVPINNSQWNTDTIFLAGIVNVEPVSSIVPEDYYLSQNFPNPFNPVTKITFSIPKRAFTSLKIYDITGREIRTYINAVSAPGTYSVSFDGSGLSSGVYFYSLITDEFTATKKMVLIK